VVVATGDVAASLGVVASAELGAVDASDVATLVSAADSENKSTNNMNPRVALDSSRYT
jgi:hypothetical protein